MKRGGLAVLLLGWSKLLSLAIAAFVIGCISPSPDFNLNHEQPREETASDFKSYISCTRITVRAPWFIKGVALMVESPIRSGLLTQKQALR